MEQDNTVAIIAIILGALALVGCAFVYYSDDVGTTDLSGVESKITTLSNNLYTLQNKVNNIDLDVECDCDVDSDDFEDLEDDVNDDINDLEDDFNDLIEDICDEDDSFVFC